MEKTKLIQIVILVLLIVIFSFAVVFYQQKEKLSADNKKLTEEKTNLIAERDALQDKNAKLERDRETYEKKIQDITDSLNSMEKDQADLKKRYEDVSRQRDELVEKLKEKPKVEAVTPQPAAAAKTETSPVSEEYWADFVKVKAAMEVNLEDLKKQLNEAKLKLADMEKTNKELSTKIDDLSKDKERLENEMQIKIRTMNIVSRDLVNEREARKIAMNELSKLRAENSNLKRELVILNKEKVRLQENMQDVVEKKNTLQQKISGVENVMKEKSLELEELQKELTTTIKGDKGVISRETASVELPPIVVKPGLGPRGLRGQVLAVNNDERFIVVNMGESSGVGPGNQLKVFRGNKEIGTVEVIETRKDISAADIKDIAPGVAIQEGDAVITK